MIASVGIARVVLYLRMCLCESTSTKVDSIGHFYNIRCWISMKRNRQRSSFVLYSNAIIVISILCRRKGNANGLGKSRRNVPLLIERYLNDCASDVCHSLIMSISNIGSTLKVDVVGRSTRILLLFRVTLVTSTVRVYCSPTTNPPKWSTFRFAWNQFVELSFAALATSATTALSAVGGVGHMMASLSTIRTVFVTTSLACDTLQVPGCSLLTLHLWMPFNSTRCLKSKDWF